MSQLGWSRALRSCVMECLNADGFRYRTVGFLGNGDCMKEYRGFEVWWFSRVSDGFQCLDAL